MYCEGGHKTRDYRRDFRLATYAMNKKMVKIYFSDEAPAAMPPPPPRSALPVKTSRPSSRFVASHHCSTLTNFLDIPTPSRNSVVNDRVSSGSRTRTLPSRPPGPPPTGGRPAPVTSGVKTMSGSMVNIAKVGHIMLMSIQSSLLCTVTLTSQINSTLLK